MVSQQAEISLLNDAALSLTGDLNFTSAPMLLSKVKKLLSQLSEKQLSEKTDKQNHIDINVEKVTDCNSAGIAFLLELNRLCHDMGKRLRIQNMSEQMEIIARVHGVDESLKTMMS